MMPQIASLGNGAHAEKKICYLQEGLEEVWEAGMAVDEGTEAKKLISKVKVETYDGQSRNLTSFMGSLVGKGVEDV